jgi:ribonuclease P protein component
MLPKNSRLTKKEIEFLFKKSRSLSTPCFFLKVLKRKLPESRYCIIFSKQLKLKGVERNKVKRRIAESIRKNKELGPQGYDIAFIIKPLLLEKTRKEIEPVVHEALITLQQYYG